MVIKLTEDLEKQICTYVGQGNTFERACRLVGLNDKIYRLWKTRGEKEKSGKYFKLLQNAKVAEDKYKAFNIATILTAAKGGSWQASAWLLERNYPVEFGKQQHTCSNSSTKMAKNAGLE